MNANKDLASTESPAPAAANENPSGDILAAIVQQLAQLTARLDALCESQNASVASVPSVRSLPCELPNGSPGSSTNGELKIKWTDVEKTLLDFDNKGETHPTEFMDTLEGAFHQFPMDVNRQQIIILGKLQGEPRTWFMAFRYELKNFEQFKNKFMDKYWNERKRRTAMTNFYSLPFNSKFIRNPSYFVLELKRKSYPILDLLGGEKACVETIIRKLPLYWSTPLLASGVSSFDILISTLESIESGRGCEYANEAKPNAPINNPRPINSNTRNFAVRQMNVQSADLEALFEEPSVDSVDPATEQNLN